MFVNENFICNSEHHLIAKHFTTLDHLMIMNRLMSINDLRVIKQIKDIKLSIMNVDIFKNANYFVMMNTLKTIKMFFSNSIF